MPHDAQGAERGEEEEKHLPPQCFCQEKKSTKSRSIIRGFSLFVGGFGT